MFWYQQVGNYLNGHPVYENKRWIPNWGLVSLSSCLLLTILREITESDCIHQPAGRPSSAESWRWRAWKSSWWRARAAGSARGPPCNRLHYRVTHQIGPNLPLTSKQSFRPGQAWRPKSCTFVIMSTGGLAQCDVSPCTNTAYRIDGSVLSNQKWPFSQTNV